MKEESIGRWASFVGSNGDEPSKQTLHQFEGLWICYQEEDKSGIKGILGFQSEV